MIGPKKLAEAAKHRHEHELARLRPVDQLGIGEADAKPEDGAADGAECGRDHERRQAKAMDMNAEVLRLARIVADRPQVQPERRMHDPPHQAARAMTSSARQ